MASGVGIFFGVVILLLVLGGIGWVAYTRIRAKRLGLPPPPLNPFASRSRSAVDASGYPAPAPGGFVGWVNEKISGFKNRRNNDRYASGAYEETARGGGGGPRRGHVPLDPDEAWDSRVGNETDVYGPSGYYEEQELALHDPAPYAGGGYVAPSSVGVGGERGRSRTRELDERYDEEMGRAPAQNPFGDAAERSDLSMRGVSPRPLDTNARNHPQGSTHNSPTERRSMFREDV